MSSTNTPAQADLQYPVGRFQRPAGISATDLKDWTAAIEELPEKLSAAIAGLSEQQLEAPYRPGGWTVRQVVHHLADSHMNCYLRYRFALTEDRPRITAYDEAIWAELPDAKSAPADLSIDLLTGLHRRWAMLLRSMSEQQFARAFIHPEHGEMRLDWATGMYAWHGRHHVAQIIGLRRRENWL